MEEEHYSRPRRSDRHVKRKPTRISDRQLTREEGPDFVRAPRKRAGVVVESAPQMRVQRQRRGKRARAVALVALTVIVVLIVGVAAWGWSFAKSFEKKVQGNAKKQDSQLAAALTAAKKEQPFTVLLIGDDRRPGETMARADTMILAKVDPKQGKVWMLSIPRDTRVEIPGHGECKINAASFYGGPSLAVKTVQEFTGVPINHYMSMNFDGFSGMVDSLGGVWINVDTPIDDRKAASHSKGRAASRIDPGMQLLDGEHALTYVRSRAFVDADFTRMKHQQQFFKALADQATKFGNILKLPGMVEAMATHMSTDMSLSQMINVALALKGMGGASVQTATVLGEWRSPYVWTDEELKHKLVAIMEAGGSFDQTSTPAAQLSPENISVTIRNGAGVSGVAAEAASIVENAGFKMGDVGNANQFVYDRTLVVYKDNKGAAELVASKLPKADVVSSNGMYTFTTDVLVVIGKDWPPATAGSSTQTH